MTQEEEEAQLSSQLQVCPRFAEALCAEIGFPLEGTDIAEVWVVQVGFALRVSAAVDCAKAAQLVA